MSKIKPNQDGSPIEIYQENGSTFLVVKDKQKYLDEHSPFEDSPKLTDEKYCLHCGKTIKVGDYKVELFKDEDDGDIIGLISCPNAPKCNGTIIDWVDSKHK